jgi:hypothetical protein
MLSVHPAYSLFGCTPGLSHSCREKSPKAEDQENEMATHLALFISINWAFHIQTVMDSLSKMNRCAIQSKNKIVTIIDV